MSNLPGSVPDSRQQPPPSAGGAARSHPAAGFMPRLTRLVRFWQQLRPRQPDAPLRLTRGGGHTMTTWRALVPSMHSWMTRAWPGPGRGGPAAGCRPAGQDLHPGRAQGPHPGRRG